MADNKSALQSRFGVILLAILAIGLLHATPVLASSIVVENDCTIANAIESANQDRAIGGCAAGSGADSIELTASITLSEQLPAITSTIAIRGNGFVINGEQRFRLFYITEDGDLSIDGLRLQNAQAQAEARTCIEWEEGEWIAGGAICNLGKLSISDSYFSGNQSDFGGAIASVGALNIFNSVFTGNESNGGGAIFNWAGGELAIRESIFDGNAAKITFALLERILAEMEDSDEDSDERIAVDPVFFVGHGGAIASSLGGAITITETTFRGNLSDLGGGALLDHGTTEIIDCQFTNNSSINGSGGAIENRMGAVNVTGSIFDGNSAGLGGAVDVWGSFTVADSQFNKNTATRGGAINTAGGTLSVTDSVFSGNSASDSGGAIGTFNWAGGLVSVTNSVFSDNSARIRGGAIFGSGTIEIRGSEFRGNSAGDLGGAIINGGTLTVTDSVFSGNSATEGAGIYNDRDNVVEQDGNSYRDNRGGDCQGCG